jgi:CMP-N-acetylneuraminic acid synthetase
MSLVAFLPCRRGSQRVPLKNVKPFAGFEQGLLQVKLTQLDATEGLDAIVVSSNDPLVLEIAGAFARTAAKEVRVIPRRDELGSSSTTTDELVAYVPTIVPDETILWTHVTSPFVGAPIYEAAIAAWREGLAQGFDSLMSVTALQSFIWNEDGPINYDRAQEKWPRTQTLQPLYEVNSAIFIAARSTYLERGDRIGRRPFLYAIDHLASRDIDWSHDFVLAEQMVKSRLVTVP